MPEETYETHGLKCPYCGKVAMDEGEMHDCFEEIWQCDSCEHKFLATITSFRDYTGTPLIVGRSIND